MFHTLEASVNREVSVTRLTVEYLKVTALVVSDSVFGDVA
jgi:hypothetical protein